MALVERTLTIVNELGLHARPSAAFVKKASMFKCEILITRDDMSVNGKSILGLMTLAAEQGAELSLRAEGDDADEAAAALTALVASGFDE